MHPEPKERAEKIIEHIKERGFIKTVDRDTHQHYEIKEKVEGEFVKTYRLS